jgi:hypothetical protein
MVLEHLFFFPLDVTSIMLGETILSDLVISPASHNNDIKYKLRMGNTK